MGYDKIKYVIAIIFDPKDNQYYANAHADIYEDDQFEDVCRDESWRLIRIYHKGRLSDEEREIIFDQVGSIVHKLNSGQIKELDLPESLDRKVAN